MYDASDRILNIVRVKEKFNDGQSTHLTRLPPKTDFVTVRVLCADDTPVSVERKPFNARYALWLALFCVLLALTVDLLLWVGLTTALRVLDSFTASLDVSAELWAEVLGFTALGAAVLSAAVALAHFFLLRKKEER